MRQPAAKAAAKLLKLFDMYKQNLHKITKDGVFIGNGLILKSCKTYTGIQIILYEMDHESVYKYIIAVKSSHGSTINYRSCLCSKDCGSLDRTKLLKKAIDEYLNMIFIYA